MRKINFLLISFVVSMIVSSCVKGDLVSSKSGISPLSPTEESNLITYEEAQKEVVDLLDFLDTKTRSNTGRRIANGFKSNLGSETTRSDDKGEEMPVYVFNFEDNNGFAIVSGDNRVGSVLALTENGNIYEGMEVNNPGLAIFLERLEVYYKETINASQSEDANSTSGTGNSVPSYTRSSETGIDIGGQQPVSRWVNDAVYGTIIPAKWGQGAPYNDKCPHQDKAGCVPVAVAQIMYHHGYPASYNGHTFDWNEMRKHIDSDDIANDTIHPDAHGMIARLIQQLGTDDNLRVDYGASESSAKHRFVNNTFRHFGYNVDSDGVISYNSRTILGEVINNRPVYVCGASIKEKHKALGIVIYTDYHHGHAWVIDAVLRQNQVEGGRYTGVFRDLVHCNWGWDGLDNGFYISKAFDTNEGPVAKDKDIEGMTRGSDHYGERYNYQYEIKMVTSISPKN